MKIIKLLLASVLAGSTTIMLAGCYWFNPQMPRNIILSTIGKKGEFASMALEKVVAKFNEKLKTTTDFNVDNRKVEIKYVQKNAVENQVNAGFYGVRKLPNLAVAYGDEALRYEKGFTDNQTPVSIQDINQIINRDEIVDSFWQETTYNNKLYVAPVGKSVDYMYVNQKMLIEVFAKAGLENQARLLLQNIDSSDNLNNYRGQNGAWKVANNYKFNSSDYGKQLDWWKSRNTIADIRAGLSRWDGFLYLAEITHELQKNLTNLNSLNEVYVIAMDNLLNGLYAQYANSGLLSYEARGKNFLYYEEQKKFFLNLAGQSLGTIRDNLQGIQRLKDLKQRTAASIKRITGLQVKTVSADSPLGVFSSDMFKTRKTAIGIGSSAGIQFYLDELDKDPKDKEKLSEKRYVFAKNIWAVPLPFTDGGKSAIQQGPGLVMFKFNDPIKDRISEEFIKFMMKPEINEEYAVDSGYLPVNKTSYFPDSTYGKNLDNNPKKPYLSIIKQIWQGMADKKITTSSPPLTLNGSVFRNTMDKMMAVFYQDLHNGYFDGTTLTLDQYLAALKQQLIDDGINGATILEN